MPAPRILRWLLVLLWMGVIFAISSLPTPAPADLTGRKLWILTFAGAVHLAEYAILAVLVLFAIRRLTWWSAALALSLAIAFGITDEVHQSFVPPREATVRDLGLDALGALIAVAGAFLVQALQRARRERKPLAERL